MKNLIVSELQIKDKSFFSRINQVTSMNIKEEWYSENDFAPVDSCSLISVIHIIVHEFKGIFLENIRMS